MSDIHSISSSPTEDTWPSGVTPQPYHDPTAIGRFRVRRRVGAGGMGIVFAAQDQELERTVAIKLLIDGDDHSIASRERLRREAQVMARLSHPNVIPVYEVGEHEGAIFVVMEYVRGGTLREWVEEERPEWEQVLRAYLEAAKGLAAAHAAGIVHRDFKPENVLRSRQGRVAVVDFGLARTQLDGRDTTLSIGSTPPAAATLTGTGTRIGTPGYMSPEQIRGGRGDAHSDQFSFAVALWEALYEEHPFGVRAWPALAVAVVHGELNEPADPGAVPPRVQKVLERALSTEPTERWSSVGELMNELKAAAWPRRRRPFLVGGLAVLALGAASIVGYAVGHHDPLPGCERPATERIAEVWSDGDRERLRERFDVIGQAHVPATWAHVDGSVHDWLQRWSSLQQQTCRDSVDADDEARALLSRRAACLSTALDSVDVLRSAMTELDPLAFSNGDAGTGQSLADLTVCESDEAVSRRLPEPVAEREEIREVRTAVARGEILALAGDSAAAQAVLEPLPERAEAIDYPPLRAEVAFARAQVDGSEAAMRDVVLGAERDANDAVLAHALVTLSAKVDDDDEADHLLARAEAAVARAGSPLGLRIAVAGQKVEQALDRGDYEQALKLQPDLLELVLDAGREGTPAHGWAVGQRGKAWLGLHEPTKAETALREALAIYEGALGPSHPELVYTLSPLAEALDQQDRGPAANEIDARIIDLLKRTHPELEHAHLGWAYYRKAIRRFSDGSSYPLAIDFAVEAVGVMSRALGPEHPATADVRYYLARIRAATGALSAAAEDLDFLLAHEDSLPEAVKRVDVYGMRALLRARNGDAAGAREDLLSATTVRAGPAEAPIAAIHRLEWSADVAEAQGRIDEALAMAELSWALWEGAAHKHKERSLHRAMARVGHLRVLAGHLALAEAPLLRVATDAGDDARWPFLPDVHFGLAQVQLSTGDLQSARLHAERAHEGLAAIGPSRAASRDEVAAWIAALPSDRPAPDDQPTDDDLAAD